MKLVKQVEVKLKIRTDSTSNQLNFCNNINEPMSSNKSNIEMNPTIAQILKSLETLTTKVNQITDNPQYQRNRTFPKKQVRFSQDRRSDIQCSTA